MLRAACSRKRAEDAAVGIEVEFVRGQGRIAGRRRCRATGTFSGASGDAGRGGTATYFTGTAADEMADCGAAGRSVDAGDEADDAASANEETGYSTANLKPHSETSTAG